MNRWHLKRGVRVLRRGGVIAYPTEAVWGLGCDPLNPEAVYRLLVLKSRPEHKGLILVAADWEQLQPFVQDPGAAVMADVLASWPGFATWILPARAGVPAWLTGRHSGLAVRVSAHPPVVQLCRAYGGPLVSTSANPSARPPARSALGVRRYFHASLDAIVPGVLGGAARPSPIRDAISARVLRR